MILSTANIPLVYNLSFSPTAEAFCCKKVGFDISLLSHIRELEAGENPARVRRRDRGIAAGICAAASTDEKTIDHKVEKVRGLCYYP